jgi:cellulose synthase/poly-beta-1,6-N-acetylglucosamine synthase-like glycosyltransferase
MKPLVSIIVPHYQTPALVKLCLRSVRKFTAGIAYEVIVVDNASKDGASLDYLRSVDWIRLIERKGDIATGGPAHIEAVELGFEAALAPYLLTIHTDTFPIRSDWLQYHLNPMLNDERIAAVGTDKLVLRSKFQESMRVLEDAFMFWKRFRSVRQQNRERYIRSHCALYRRSALEKHNLSYHPIPNLTAGQGLHREFTRFGYECRLLDPRDVAQRVVHLNHATELLLPELQERSRLLHLWRGRSRISRFFHRADIQAILNDNTLDVTPETVKAAA